jgi:S-adenosylmethionine:diacylglycerol 3-amino-3-carboxypropyl transferase
MLVRAENRRISNIRMAEKSFDRVKQNRYTRPSSDEIKAVEEEYWETRTITNPRVAYLLREINAFGYGQHISNEERLYDMNGERFIPFIYTRAGIIFGSSSAE